MLAQLKPRTVDIFRLSILLVCSIQTVFGYSIEIKNDGPIVRGGTINFYASVYDGDSLASGTFSFKWADDFLPNHHKDIIGNSTSTWTLTYDVNVTPGTYTVRVEACYLWPLKVCFDPFSVGSTFQITDTFNGKLDLIQKNQTRLTKYVSNTDTVLHQIELKDSDREVLKKAPTVLSYWFVDCVYYGITNNLQFPFNYTEPDSTHMIAVLVVADFTPLPPSTTVPPSTTSTTTAKPTTTTTKPTTTTTKKPTVVNGTLTTTASSHTSVSNKSAIRKRDVKSTAPLTNSTVSQIKIKVNGTLVPYNVSFPYVCKSTAVAKDDNKIYGYFFKEIVVKEPITKVNVTGNNWLRQGELLSLDFKCRGSQKLQYCTQFKRGLYNVTGNETCAKYLDLETCEYSYKRYIAEEHSTVIIIVKNDVSKVVTPVAITIYKVKSQAQLSVIVVPVVFSIIAVILMVFGVAYYVQHRSRFTIEVADFDFGHQYNDMEYKTFKERLKDSITNAFTREPSPTNSEVPVWPPGHKYGSMT